MSEQKENLSYSTRFWGHLRTINEHRGIVFRLCCKCGIPGRGVVHDLSKYSFKEFFEGVRHFHGDKSPNSYCIKENGYSEAWLHHKGRNDHHHEYWYDYNAKDKTPMMPYKPATEAACDNLGAGLTYLKDKWYPYYQYEYWLKRKEKFMINSQTYEFLLEVFRQVGEQGIDKTLTKQNLTKQYVKYCGPIKR